MYKGDTRTRTIGVYVDNAMVTSWTSSGTTTAFESIDLGASGQAVELRGVLADSEWLSITEVEVLVDDGVHVGSGSDDDSTTDAVLASSLTPVTTLALLYDTNLAVDGGCDPNGCTASNTQSRPHAVKPALYKGDTRTRTVEVHVDGVLVTTWTSSGTTAGFEGIDLSGSSGSMIEIVGVLDDSEWLSIIETEIMAFPDDGVTPPPSDTPTATPSPASTPQPASVPPAATPSPAAAPQPVTPTGDLQPVGLLPLVVASGTSLEKSYIKDGDLSTSWTCSGDPHGDDDPYYDCNIYFNLYSYRHVKQVKIALADGTGAVDMRIAAEFNGDLAETFVTSSGSADGFETYEFDVFTDTVAVAGLFASNGQSITILEVEIVEEVQTGEVTVTSFNTPYDNGDGLWTGPTTDGFDWSSDSDEALDRTLSWSLNSYATMDAIEMQFPVGDTYKFDLELFDGGDDARQVLTGLESQDAAGWQSFDLSGYTGEYVTLISLVIKGTGSGAPGFKLLDARFMGTPIDNPSDTFYVGSTWLEDWGSTRYPDFVAEGSGDQKAIMGAICAVKKASFDGVDCVGGDDSATGTVEINFGEWFVDGNIFMKSGVFLNARYSIDDSPYTTDILVEEGAAGKTDIDAVVVMDGISGARIDDLWIRGRYDPDSDAAAVAGFGSVGLSIVGSSNITCIDTEIRYCDGDALVVRNSQNVSIDAGSYDEEYLPWTIGISRGTGIVVDSSDAVWVRRHTVYDNGVAGIHVMGSNNFTFEATIADECYGDPCVVEGEGNVGSLNGQQPIEVIIETSTDVKFQDMRVQSVNDPVMTVSSSTGVSFDNCGFSNVEFGTCVIKVLDAASEVETGGDAELSLQDTLEAVVDAGAVTSVAVEAPLYDPNLSDARGCDPAGCVGDLTRDGDLAPSSRWSCKPSLGPAGSTCSITYTLGDTLDLVGLNVAMYKGDTRTRMMDVYVDDTMIASWTSSGTTTAFENIELRATGQTVELRGVLDDSEWLSITEVEICVDDGGTTNAVPASSLTTVTTLALLYDTNLAVDGGCDPNGCTASNTQDGDMADNSRWSCAPKLGGKCSISYTFGMALDLSELRLALYKGTTRVRTVEVYADGVLVTTWTSSGTTEGFESVDISGTSGSMLEIVGVLEDSEWLSIIETEIMVFPEAGVTPPPSTTPTATPGPAPTPEPVTPSGDLQPVGLIPLVTGAGENPEQFYLKDGDLSTTWSCTGDPLGPDEEFYDCSIYFNLYSYRHVKQVKIALLDGAGAVDMRITGSQFFGDLGEKFVTSSGSADGFEAYDFDVFTKTISITGVFTSNGQTITISEVEILEEVQPGEVTVTEFNTPFDNGDGLWIGPTTDAFDWSSDSDEALDRTLSWSLNSYATIDAIEMQFPVGDTYKFDLELFDGGDDARQVLTGLESEDTDGWQSFDLTSYAGEYVTVITLVIKGTGSGAPGFKLLDARFMGTPIDNPSDTFYVGSTWLEDWGFQRYPDFVAEGSGDQKAIMGAICAVKKAYFDGVDCVGGEDTATGTVEIPFGEWFVDGNIFMKSGVFLDARYSIDDWPYTTDIVVEEGAAGKTDIDAIVVMDGISGARVDDLFIHGNYDPESGAAAVTGFGSVGVSIVGSSNITCLDTDIRYCDGDALVVRNSHEINIDAGSYDEEFVPWTIGISRGTGILVDSSDAVWVRRHTVYDNGVAGIHVTGSNNFTFEATIADECFGPDCVLEGEGNVGSLDGQQPIEVVIETSTDVKFHDMRVQSVNDPVMTVSASASVSFDNCGFSNVEPGTCVIQVLDADSEVVTGGDPELSLQDTPAGPCWVKV
eukprot:g13318.t1